MSTPALDRVLFRMEEGRKTRYHDGLEAFLKAVARGDVFRSYDDTAWPYTIFLRQGTIGYWTEDKELLFLEALAKVLNWPRPGSEAAELAGAIWHEGVFKHRSLADGTAASRKAFAAEARKFIEEALT